MMEKREAYMLCSIVVDLKINEVVDQPNWVVDAYLPLTIFEAVQSQSSRRIRTLSCSLRSPLSRVVVRM
jgi:hypothetical protein